LSSVELFVVHRTGTENPRASAEDRAVIKNAHGISTFPVPLR
jgi:hypothetical protein